MKAPKNEPSGPRVFILGFRSCEIVFLPATGEITTRFVPDDGAAADGRKIRAASSPAEDEGREEE